VSLKKNHRGVFVNGLLPVIRGEKVAAANAQTVAGVSPFMPAAVRKNMPGFARAVAQKINPAQQPLLRPMRWFRLITMICLM
jgi:hypothetical protein